MENIIIKKLTENEFYGKFKLEQNNINNNAGFDGCLFETYGKELDYVFEMSKKKRVVTIIELDEDREEIFIDNMGVEITETSPNLCYASGFHYVNRLGFFVIDKPYEFEFEFKVD